MNAIKKNIPNAISMSFGLCGLGAVVAVLDGRFDIAVLLWIVAYVLDALDGKAARSLGVSGPLGLEVDTMNDCAAWGALPALAMFLIVRPVVGTEAAFGAAAAIQVGALARLARFNFLEKNPPANAKKRPAGVSLGMPAADAVLVILAGAALWKGYFDGSQIGAWLVVALAVVIAALMVSRLPYCYFKGVLIRRWLTLTLFVPAVAVGIVTQRWEGAFAWVAVAYVAHGLYFRVIYGKM